MTGARGIVAAGLLAIAVTSAHALYRSWPVTHGTEICVPAALYRQPVEVGLVMVRLPFEWIELDVPHTGPAVTETYEPVRRIGGWWITSGDKTANMRARRGRPLYLQFTPGQPVFPGGPPEMQPVTVSDTAIDGPVNLVGTVVQAREDGYVRLAFPFGWIGVPHDVEAAARPMDTPGPRANNAGSIRPGSDPGVFAVLKVLPSGRAALTGVIVNGKRY